jgi:two-component system cell cycle sensor histidine kinase/response regulator CckA
VATVCALADPRRRVVRGREIDTIVHPDDSTPSLLLAAQAQLRANEHMFRAVFDGAMDAMLIANDSGYYVDANPAATILFGLPRERLVGRFIGDFVDPILGSAETWAQFLRDGKLEGQFRLSRPDGSERDIDFRATANILPGLNLSVLRDMTEITERKRAEDALRASELRYRRIVDNTSEGIWMYDAAGTTTFMNPRMAEMLGCTVEDAVGEPIFTFMHESAGKAARIRVARRTLGIEERGDFLLRRRDGSDLWVSVHANPLSDESGKFEIALTLVTDITDRRRADETRNRLASIVASSDDAIISQGVDGLIRTWNRGAEKLTQYSAEEAVGQPITMLYPPEQMSRLGDLRRHVADAQRLQQFEMVCVRKDGTYVDVAVTSSVLVDDQDEVRGVSIIARDITERLRSEAAVHRSDEQLRHAQKMEAIGSLAGGVAHDFNNLLSVILSYTSLMVDELKPSDPLRADIEEVHKAGLRATVLTSQLLAFSRHQMLRPIVLDLNRIVSELETMLGRLLREDIQLTLLPAPRAGNVYADAGQIEQVITNLVVNARDAMPNGGSLTIETAFVVLDESYAAAHVGVLAGPYISMAVTDTGTGMDAATLERIFEPFFTTKDSTKGTGLGLSTVYGIIQQSGGHIHVDSEVGKGTTFTIYLPRTDRLIASELRAIVPLSTLRGTETILLVEDEEQVLAVMRAILRKHGYNVLEARNGGEAFLACEQFPGGIDLLLTDVVMPRMSGRQLAERLLRLRPAMKVLYVSGYADDAIVYHGVPAAGVAFLQKPVLPATLLEKIRQLLDSSSPLSAVSREA